MLNEKQLKAIDFISTGMTYREVAVQLDTTYTTVYRWRQKEEFKKALLQANKNKAMGNATEDEHKIELDAYRRGRMDGLVLQAVNTLGTIMTSGVNEGARVNAAKYVLEKFGQESTTTEDRSGVEELKSLLRVVSN
tara:strand:+ start:206 stop:613 length:408 start_codon:yes stop_codon:yes gene_type:complete